MKMYTSDSLEEERFFAFYERMAYGVRSAWSLHGYHVTCIRNEQSKVKPTYRRRAAGLTVPYVRADVVKSPGGLNVYTTPNLDVL
jgi:hypothetical protein